MNRTSSKWIAFALGLVLSIPSSGQSGLPEDYLFTDVIDVQLVNVEVWVTDRSGVAVSGLTAEDFELYEDGKQVEISFFTEIRDSARLPEAVPALAPSSAAEATAPTTEPGHLILYFDQLHLTPTSRRRALEDIREFLAAEYVPPQNVLILRQEEGLTTEAAFGSSWADLDRALDRLSDSKSRGALMSAEKRLAIRNLQQLWDWAVEIGGLDPTAASAEAACQVFVPRATPDIENYAAESRARISKSLDHLASVASFLTGIPGPKTLLYVSDALERAPGADMVAFVNALCPVQTNTPMFLLSDELSREFQELSHHANANRVTIYTLQGEGLTAGYFSQASEGTVDLNSIQTFDSAIRTAERDGMKTLAGETGGRAIFDSNDFAADLQRIAQDMASYYSLAYEPPHGGDGGDHRIEVKLKNKSLRARYRPGYQDKSADVRMTERLQGAVYLGLVENPLGVRLAAGALSVGEKEFVRLPLHVLVPAEKVVFLPREDGVTAQISVQVSTRNTVDNKGLFDHRAYRVNWQKADEREMVDLVVELEIPPGVHLVAVGVRDDATRDTSFVSTTVEIHPPPNEVGAGH